VLGTFAIRRAEVVLAGVIVVALATIPFAFVSDHTPYALLGGALFVRGRSGRRAPARRARRAERQPSNVAGTETGDTQRELPRADAA
jgi:hypothetical protein